MANTYYDSDLTGEEIEQALEAIDGVIVPANNGKVLAVDNGKIVARSVQRSGGGGNVSSVNNILPDLNGNVTVTADDIQTDDNTSVQDEIDSAKNTLTKLVPILPGSTNNLGYTLNVGDYFEAGGVLYKVITAIPNTEAWAGKASALTDTAVNDLNNTIAALSKIYIDTTGSITTTSTGNVPLRFTTHQKKIISAWDISDHNLIIIPWRNNNDSWLFRVTDSNGNAAGNTTLNVAYLYTTITT